MPTLFKRKPRFRFYLALLMGTFFSTPATAEPLRIVAAGSPPFIVSDEGNLTGISVQVWRAIAKKTGRTAAIVQVKTVETALATVAAGEADVAIGPISITSQRARQAAFTQPYFQGSLSILSPASTAFSSAIKPFLSRAFLFGAAVLLLLLLGVGGLVWLTERRKNPENFPADALRGVWSGVWFALVTMTTVGYGDKAPITPAGRAITGVWMLISLVLVASFTAFMATTLTLSQLQATTITSADELKGRKVTAIQGSTAASFAKDYGARLVPVSSLEEAVTLVAEGEVDAAVGDRPTLLYYLQTQETFALQVAEATYRPQGYGFAFQLAAPALRNELNVALLGLKENGTIDEIIEAWLQ